MKHAYLIIAHNNWNQLKMLLSQIDDPRNDIYLHIDKKAKNVPIKEFEDSVKKSKIFIYSEFKVYWGSVEMIKTELFLLKNAIKCNYDYYHLISGCDLLIKSNDYIDNFFINNKGKEFVHFDTEERLKKDKEILRRTKYYHLFTNYRRAFKHRIFNYFFDFLARSSLVLQSMFFVNRHKALGGLKIKYGSQWFSITNAFAKYLVTKEEEILKIFKLTKCSDELVVQTILFNSNFKNNLFNTKFDGDCMSNLRLIDFKRGKNGNPYTWHYDDIDIIKSSKCLFARKFDYTKENKIVDFIINNRNNF